MIKSFSDIGNSGKLGFRILILKKRFYKAYEV